MASMESRIGTLAVDTPATKTINAVSPLTGWLTDRLALAVASSSMLRHPLRYVDLKHRVCEPATEDCLFVESPIGHHEGIVLSILSGPYHPLLRQVCTKTRNYLREFLELSQPVFPWPMGIKAQML